jgi:hypothetical protein
VCRQSFKSRRGISLRWILINVDNNHDDDDDDEEEEEEEEEIAGDNYLII